MLFELEKPDVSRVDRKKLLEVLIPRSKQAKEVLDFVRRFLSSEYLYWDKIRHKQDTPRGFSKEELWVIIKILRQSKMKRY